MKRLFFLGDTLDQIRWFPLKVRSDVGSELRRVQMGLDPMDWKPMKTIGAGVREIRVRDAAGAFRVIYVLRSADAIFVLNAFHKKTQKSPKHELELAARRLKLI
jgi:phage-related protein